MRGYSADEFENISFELINEENYQKFKIIFADVEEYEHLLPLTKIHYLQFLVDRFTVDGSQYTDIDTLIQFAKDAGFTLEVDPDFLKKYSLN